MVTSEKARYINVLVVDDDQDDRQIAQEELLKHPCVKSVHIVEDGVEMLNYLRQCNHAPLGVPVQNCIQKPDIILLDLQMPRMNGSEALQAVKNSPELADIPVIIFSTSISVEDIENCYRLGASTYINKPDNYSKLMKTMQGIGDYWSKMACLPPTRFYCPSATFNH